MQIGDILYNPSTNKIIEVNGFHEMTVCDVTMEFVDYYDTINKIVLNTATYYYLTGPLFGSMLNSKGKLDNFYKIGELEKIWSDLLTEYGVED